MCSSYWSKDLDFHSCANSTRTFLELDPLNYFTVPAPDTINIYNFDICESL